MNGPRPLLVREVQLAFMLGFNDVEPFRRALRAGDIPAPNEYMKGKPVWYVADLERRYGAGFFRTAELTEHDVNAAIDEM